MDLSTFSAPPNLQSSHCVASDELTCNKGKEKMYSIEIIFASSNQVIIYNGRYIN